MATQATEESRKRSQDQTPPNQPKACPGFGTGAQTMRLWATSSEHPDPRFTFSDVWATSVLWAVESFSDFILTTLRNEPCASSRSKGSSGSVRLHRR